MAKDENSLIKKIEQCKVVLKQFLTNSPMIIVNTSNLNSYLDDVITNYLFDKGHKDWLVLDPTQRYQVGGISENALCSLVEEGKVFGNPHVGNYKLKEAYGTHSVRMFQAFHAGK